MLKEIFEQSAIMRRILMGRVDFAHKTLMAEAFHGMHDEAYERIVLVGCGTSYNAALV
jgi:glucosamine 6-phosphate synthetase-like amidotransferase/phosphosugar isomerase protein